MAEHGGEMTPKALQGLKKLDSFIMETNRKQAVSYGRVFTPNIGISNVALNGL